MGHVLRMPTAASVDWPRDLQRLRDLGFHTLALTPNRQATSIHNLDLRCPPDRLALVLGAEGPGLTEDAMAAVDHSVRIDMNEGMDSLNVAVSAAVAMSALCAPGACR